MSFDTSILIMFEAYLTIDHLSQRMICEYCYVVS